MSLVTVAKFYNLIDAQIAHSKLESASINNFLFDDNMSSAYGAVAGGTRLQVIEEDVNSAKIILDIKEEQENPTQTNQKSFCSKFIKTLFCSVMIATLAWYLMQYWGSNLDYIIKPIKGVCIFFSNAISIDSNPFTNF